MSVCSEPGFSSEEVLNLRFPLHRACRDGDLCCLRSLLQGPPGNTALQLGMEDSCYGWTPIHWAAHFGKLECLVQLVGAGCSVNASTTRFAQTPAHIAAFGGHPHCLLWLIQAGAHVNKQDYVGETPVHKAARAGSMDCLKALVSSGAQIKFSYDLYYIYYDRNEEDNYLLGIEQGPIKEMLHPNKLLQDIKAAIVDCGFITSGTVLPFSFTSLNNDCDDLLCIFRNASGLTAADLAHSQGFRECAQFLLNLQNSQLNGFYCSSSFNGVHQNNSSNHLNGGTNNRKRSFHDLEASTFKKLRTEASSFVSSQAEYMAGGMEDDDENMHVETQSEISDMNGSTHSTLTNGQASNEHIAPLGEMETSPAKCLLSPKGFCNVTNGNKESPDGNGTFTENKTEATTSQACGSLHVNGSPGNCVTPRPSWGEEVADVLQYGYYHGYGDSAESVPEFSSLIDHCDSVNVERKYKSTFISTLHQYQGF